MTPDVGHLPPGWERAKVGDLCEADNGRAFKSTEWVSVGLPIIRISNLKDSDAPFNYFRGELEEQYRVRAGDLLFAWSGTPGTSFGAHIWKGPEAALNQHIFNIRFRRDLIDERFLWYALNQNVVGYVAQAQGGVGLAHITKSKFMASEIPFPPAKEQGLISDAIDSYLSRLDDAVASLERVQAKLKAYRASVLKAAVEGRLVPTEAALARAEKRDYEPAQVLLARVLKERRRRWEEAELVKLNAKGKPPKDGLWKDKYKEPATSVTSDLPELPEGWCWATVEGISTKVVDGVHKKPSYVSSGVPFVTVKNLTAGPGIDLKNLKYVTIEDHKRFITRADPQRGDLLVSKDGTLGVIRAVRTDEVFSIFVSVAMIKPVLTSMTDYLELALSSSPVQAQMVPKGSGLQHIHLEDLRRDCVPLPPIAEQARILEAEQTYMSIIHSEQIEIARNIARLSRLRQAVLKWAFEGKLVDQDPNDEPAEKLLARIRSERASVGRTNKIRNNKVGRQVERSE